MAPTNALALVTTLLLGLFIYAIKRVYFNPLSKYPGPPLWALTRLPYALAMRNGDLAHEIKAFHEKYGSTIRVGPNELSYIDPDVLRDMYIKRPNQHFKCMPKDPVRLPPIVPGKPANILSAKDTDHTRIRKAWSYSFSNQALAAQEPLVASFIDKLISRLKGRVQATPEVIDLQKYYSYCNFDIICSLSFGEDFGCIDNESYHPWVETLVSTLKIMIQLAACRFYPWFFNLLLKVVLTKSARANAERHGAMSREKVKKRLDTSVDRPDFLSHLQRSREGLTEEEIFNNADTMIVAGSHTLQTALTAITYFLVLNPTHLSLLTEELRTSFDDESQMNYKTLQQLKWLPAAIQESLRLAPPVPLGLTRQIPQGGATVGEDHLPEGIVVSYMTWAANTSTRNFTKPNKFRPERWLDAKSTPEAADFANDRKDASHVFSSGPRNCIGQNLANMELILIIGRMLYNFDFAVPAGPEPFPKWEDQKTYAVWEKSPLPVKLMLRTF